MSIKILVLLLGALGLAKATSGCKEVSEPLDAAPAPLDDSGGPPRSANSAATAASDAGPESSVCAGETVICSRVECSALGPDCSPARACGASEICGQAYFARRGGTSSGETQPITFAANGPDTEKAARCALEALRDGRPGRISWGYSGGLESYTETIEIAAGRHAFGSFSAGNDSPTTKGGYAAAPLQPSSFFDDCLAQGTADAYARCFEKAVAGCSQK
jgi:hypothetical protein